MFYVLDYSHKALLLYSLVGEIINSQTIMLTRGKSKNLSFEDRRLVTQSNTSDNRTNARKSVLKGGFQLITSLSTNNRKKEDSHDSLEEDYLKEKEPAVKNSVFNLRTRNLIKTNGFLQRLSTHSEPKNYTKIVNEKLGLIKEITRQNKKEMYVLSKKKKEVKQMSEGLILYNNPSNDE